MGHQARASVGKGVSLAQTPGGHRTIKRIATRMMGFKNIQCARIILADNELMDMIHKGQMRDDSSTKKRSRAILFAAYISTPNQSNLNNPGKLMLTRRTRHTSSA